jgi:hypothetical protein
MLEEQRNFLYVQADRKKLLSMLPKGLVCCEIGVQRGSFSEDILKIAEPKKLHLIDPWQVIGESEYQNDLANVNQEKQDENYTEVTEKFSAGIESGRVQIHRGLSKDVVDQFPSDYFDFVYVDGAHYFQGVLQDLTDFSKKLKLGGIMMGHDFSENYYSFEMNFGVVTGVTTFLNRTKFRLISLTDEVWSTFAMSNDINYGTSLSFIKTTFNSDVRFISLPASLAASFRSRHFKKDNGDMRWIPSF